MRERNAWILTLLCAAALLVAGGCPTGDDDDDATGDDDTTADDDDATGDDDTSGATLLAEVQDGVFTPVCSGCHGGAAGLELGDGDTYANTVGVPANQLPAMDRVTPFELAESYLWHKVDGTHAGVGGTGSQMPLNGTLTGPEIQLIMGWIADGAEQ